MPDIDPNFSCSDPALLRGNVTESVWMVLSEGPAHENSIIAIAAFQILFVVIGIPWNSIVFIAILKKRLYNQPTYLLLLNLIVSDLLVCICVLPFNIASAIAMEFAIGDSDYVHCQVCHTIVIITITLIYVSIFTLALMSLDRLLYINSPIRYSNIASLKKVVIMLVIMWVFCIMISILPVFGIGEIKFANSLSSCSLFTAGKTRLTANMNYVLLLALVALVPNLVTLLANIWLLIIACKSVRGKFKKNLQSVRFQNHSVLEQDDEIELKLEFQTQNIYLSYLFGSIFAVSIILWAPVAIISVSFTIAGGKSVPTPLLAYMYLSFLSQTVIHPILETCLIGKARAMVFKWLCCCKKKRRENLLTSGTQRTTRANGHTIPILIRRSTIDKFTAV